MTPPGRPTRRPGDATAYMTLEGPGCCHCRYDGGEGEKGKKKEAMNTLLLAKCSAYDISVFFQRNSKLPIIVRKNNCVDVP